MAAGTFDLVDGVPFPTKLAIGQFELVVHEITHPGRWDAENQEWAGVSGTAWTRIDCGGLAYLVPGPLELEGSAYLVTSLEVVTVVTSPETQIGFEDAYRLKPDVRIGERFDLRLAVPHHKLQALTQAKGGLVAALKKGALGGDILVSFEDARIKPLSRTRGRIVGGIATYPTVPALPKIIRLPCHGFTLLIDSLELTPRGATATITVQLPPDLASAQNCGPATLDLGKTPISPACQVYKEMPNEPFGPWLIEPGLVVSGTGFTLDLSTAKSPGGRPADWTGLILKVGKATGQGMTPEHSNTGYLTGEYAFFAAVVSKTGVQAQLDLAAPFTFHPPNPEGYTVQVNGGRLTVIDGQIVDGELGPGQIELPLIAACQGAPGAVLSVIFTKLTVEKDLDLWGEVTGSGAGLAWGELTRAGNEIVAWRVEARRGFVYLPAGPIASFSPDMGTGFQAISVSSIPAVTVPLLRSLGLSGVTLWEMDQLSIFSPDGPQGTQTPYDLPLAQSWLRVGSHGMDGELRIVTELSTELGNPARPGYVGNRSFSAVLFGQDKDHLLAQFVSSAVYDADFSGRLKIPEPCNIPQLEFAHMVTTSTAHLVGGDISLETEKELEYWKLKLVPTGDPTQAGVVSARTGRLVFTAAGIDEEIHFELPFALTWGEMLADGNLKNLFFDFNTTGQLFDGLKFAPHHLILSTWVPGRTDGFLAVSGTVHLNFFGAHFINVHDARHDPVPDAASDPAYPVYRGRKVTVSKAGEAGPEPTDLTLYGDWYDTAGNPLAILHFPDLTMGYYEKAQDGFIGTGTAQMGFLHSDKLDGTVEIHRDSTDIRLSSTTQHDLDVGLVGRLGSLGSISGCIRIEGPRMERISMHGCLEASVGVGTAILEPKAGVSVEVAINVTPNSFDFMADGELSLSLAGSAVDLSASVHLLHDYLRIYP